jgi:hypothetical protein
MNQKQVREHCEKVLVPLIVAAIEPRLVDVHDMLDITASELTRLDDRLSCGEGREERERGDFDDLSTIKPLHDAGVYFAALEQRLRGATLLPPKFWIRTGAFS